MARRQERNKSVLPDHWAEPYTISELAVDSKKLSEISAWFSSNRNRCGILLITGPSGCGKTTAVKCVARSLEFEIREWVTPLDRDFENGAESGVYQNQTEKFEDYLYNCSRYSDLFVKSSSVASLLLVEDYPNIFLLKPEIFFNVLERYRRTARAPIVFICSNSRDSLDIEHKLFPDQVRVKFTICNIVLNPVTRTRMLLALKRMGAYLQTLTPGYKVPSQDTIAEICDSANGDIRYAMLTLQMKPQEDVNALFDLAGKKSLGKKRNNSQKHTQEEETVKICGKDDRVSFVHGVGRVLFPKWLNDGEKPLPSSVKRKRKEDIKHKNLNATVSGVDWFHNPNTIVDSYLSSASSFVLLIQENYLKTFSSIESVAAAAQCLSEAVVLMDGEGVESSHEMSLNLAIRGPMVHNKVPNRIFSAVRASRSREVATIQSKICSLTETLFPLYPVNHSVLMTEIVPYMFYCSGNVLSNDQRKFVSQVASMEPLTRICDLFSTFREPQVEQKPDKATYVVNQKMPIQNDQDDELHISEDESDQEIDEGADNLTLLAAAMDEDHDLDVETKNLSVLNVAITEEEQSKKLDYHALLNDSDDENILLSQM